MSIYPQGLILPATKPHYSLNFGSEKIGLRTKNSPNIYTCILNRCTVCRFGVCPFAANREYAGWMNDRVLKPARQLSLVVTYDPTKSIYSIYNARTTTKRHKDSIVCSTKNSKDSKR